MCVHVGDVVVHSYVFLFLFFRSDSTVFSDLGFGSVFDGSDEFGRLENLSTQAVLSFMKNVREEDQQEGSGFVKMDKQDVQEFHIPRSEATDESASSSSGTYCVF